MGCSIAMSSGGSYDRGFGGGRRLTRDGVDLRSLVYSQEYDDRSISVLIYVDRHT